MPTSRYIPIPNALIFTCRGKLASRYLHNRLTNDIRKLAPNGTCLAFALAPQGKIESFVLIQSLKEDDLCIIADGGDPDAAYQALNRYHVSEPFKLTRETDHALMHLVGAEAGLPGILSALQLTSLPALGKSIVSGSLTFAGRQRAASAGVDIFGPAAAIAECAAQLRKAGVSAGEPADLHALSLIAGIPWFPEILEPGELLSAGLLPGTVSFQKGCYVGQEVMEKLDSRGSHPRPLVWFEASQAAPIPPGSSVTKSGDTRPAGEVVLAHASTETNSTFGFAYLRQPVPEAKELSVLERPMKQVLFQR